MNFPTDSTDTLCTRCKKIDFDRIFYDPVDNRNVLSRWGAPGAAEITPLSDCDLCQFFSRLGGCNSKYFQLKAYETKPRASYHDDGVVSGPRDSIFLSVHDDSKDDHCDTVKMFAHLTDGDDLSGYHCGEHEGELFGRVVPPRCNFALLRRWVSLCQQNHANICDEQSPLISGLRVIDCLEQRVVEAPTTLLFEYVTLSYVWGDDQQETLDPITGLPPRLPATIADAMTVTKELGFRYIWADRYCIMQHGAGEKERQIKQMGQIYANSAVTIIDAAGSDMRCGLAGVSYNRRSQPRIRVGSHHFASVLSSAYQDIELSRWATRGWTYQEGRMARRRLVFTAQQAYFQCGDMHCIESISACFRDSPRQFAHTLWPFRPYFSHRHNRAHARQRVVMDIAIYMTRNFTFPHDRLSAFTSLLARYQEQGAITGTLAGVPLLDPVGEYWYEPVFSTRTEQLVAGLSWEILDHLDVAGMPLSYICFPSWSWVAWHWPGTQPHFPLDWDYFSIKVPSDDFIRISVVFSDGDTAPWGAGEHEIDEKLGRDSSVQCLRISAWTFDMGVETLPAPVQVTGRSVSNASSAEYRVKGLILGVMHHQQKACDIPVVVKCGMATGNNSGIWRRVGHRLVDIGCGEITHLPASGALEETATFKVDQVGNKEPHHPALSLVREVIDLY